MPYPPYNAGDLNTILSQKTCPPDVNIAVLAGLTSAGDWKAIKINDVTGSLDISATIEAGDIEIGAVEIKDATSDTRAVVGTDGTSNALIVMQNRANTVGNNQVVVTAVATVLLAVNANRKGFCLYNNGAKDCFIGNSGVTSVSGFLLTSGGTYTNDDFTGALYAICGGTDSTTVAVLDYTRA